ncbi:hypothetical protein BIW19_06825 [Pseudomonas putida]|nr:hypothetical protein BIW19_06825 [Pseudomonas putida]
MAEAAGIHHQLEINGAGVDDFFLDNYEMLKGLLSHTSMGAGVVSDGWSRYLDAIKRTLEEIEILHREYLKNGTLKARDEFYAKRMALFMKLEGQLNNMAAYGSGLQNKGSVKRALEISTKSYLHTGEIAGYAEKIAGVSKAASLIKKGTYIGLGLDVASTGLSIHHACTFGRSEDCRKAKYVEGVSLVGSTGGSIAGGSIGGFLGGTGCVLFLGVTTGGPGALACTVIGGAVGGAAGGSVVGDIGEMFGELLYEVTQ